MKDLSIGDQVLTSIGYQAVYGQVHDSTPTSTEFLQMYTMGHNKPLEVTEDHLIYLAGSGFAHTVFNPSTRLFPTGCFSVHIAIP